MRSRLAEHFNRIVREDCLTLFNRIVDPSRVECSIILANASQLSEERKYKAAAVLAVLTGQSPNGQKCNVNWEDPLAMRLSKAQLAAQRQERSAALIRQHTAAMKTRKGVVKTQPKIKLTAEDFRDVTAGFKLMTNMGKVRMWDFLEKLREFCLPDTSSLNALLVKNDNKPSERGHDNTRPKHEICRQFQAELIVKNSTCCPRRAIGLNDNPILATTTYVLRAHELLKFPDIEVHFEALGSILSSDALKDLSDPNSVRIIVRPQLCVTQPAISSEFSGLLPEIDSLKMMNWFLAQFFNEYLHRPLASYR